MENLSSIKIFLSGDVMLGRGIDQILPHPSDPRIYESAIKDAKDYIKLAEEVNGRIPQGVSSDYIWGDAIRELELKAPHFRVINLETSITKVNTPWLKGINYRMHPDNIEALTVANIDACILANNHILDWDTEGLSETLASLNKAQIHYTGAGETIQQAQTPVILSLPGMKGRILIFSFGTRSSGIPDAWRASTEHSGVWLLDQLNDESLQQVKAVVETYKQEGDLCIASIHWGGNWGYHVSHEHQIFSHDLVDKAGINVVHGHSSHHPIGIEIYKNSPILYGCGDFINDYEGIKGQEEYKDYLALMYFLEFDAETLGFKRLEIVPLARNKFRLHYAGNKDCYWLLETLQKKSLPFNTQFKLGSQGSKYLEVRANE